MSEYIAKLTPKLYTDLRFRRGEEIVRCRDCRFSHIFDGKGYPGKKYEGMTYCIAWSDGYQGEWTKPDGFCHKAKKKEVERCTA